MSLFYVKCFTRAADAKTDHAMLNHIIVGRVLTVDDHISNKLETKANTYNHHICTPKRRPGKIISIFVKNAKNSTVFGLFQYSFLLMEANATTHWVLNLLFIVFFF